jgi:hypothetical protein
MQVCKPSCAQSEARCSVSLDRRKSHREQDVKAATNGLANGLIFFYLFKD